MPSPVDPKSKMYKRKDGAYIKQKGQFKEVGKEKYKNQQHYSKHDIGADRKRKAKKDESKRKRYPQAYD